MYKKNKICVIGQGYVGFPLSVALSKFFKVTGYDHQSSKINFLKNGIDKEKILNKKFLNKNLSFSNKIIDIKNHNIYIIAVPTPISRNKMPDLKNLISATKLVSKLINPGDQIVYESTVYPGTTEEICIPIIEKNSGLKLSTNNNNNKKKVFGCSYCPERVNPGDKKRTIDKVVKVISSSSKKDLNKIFKIYKKISPAGICKAKSIKIAESAKIIENVQRDINIALINEFYLLFKKMNLNIRDILDVASSKWNFLNFKPGLVGGHCIGVDPYYLTYKAKKLKYKPKLLLAGRKINDSMSNFIFQDLLNLKNNKNNKNNKNKNLKALIIGYTFKSNVSDFRNSKVVEIIDNFIKKKFLVNIYDPNINLDDIDNHKKNLFVKSLKDKFSKYDIILYAVNHDLFRNINFNFLKSKLKKNGFIYDLTDRFDRNLVLGSL
tara:strand:- start:21283 stop:22587 length:1305 start_codon:yes stop_codon:yes gene_type:complete